MRNLFIELSPVKRLLYYTCFVPDDAEKECFIGHFQNNKQIITTITAPTKREIAICSQKDKI